MTPDQRVLILESLRAGCTLAEAQRAARVTAQAFAAECGEDREYERACEGARSEAQAEARRAAFGAVAETSKRREEEEKKQREEAEAAKKVKAIITPPQVLSSPSFDLADAAHEAAALAPGDFGFVLLVDVRCIAARMPPMSPWWRYAIGAFYGSGKPWGIFLVGRGGGKSSTLERVAAAVARYGARSVPPGQTWTWPFISVGPDDANRRINGIAAVFRADGLKVVGDLDGDGAKIKPGEGVKINRAPRGSLELLDARGNEIQLASVAGTVGNVSGPSTIGLTIDEAAKLIDARGANPLTEIVASAAQTSRGRPGWRAIMSSSAYDRAGIHFQLVQQGETPTNFVATIGPDFLDAAIDGFERVAAWEQKRGDASAAKMVRDHAASLRADSPLVPTWVANPTLGNPAGPEAWEGAALASRMLVEVLPPEALDGIPRIAFWLRECGSLPMDRDIGGDPWAQLDGLLEANEALAAISRGEPTRRIIHADHVEPMKLRDAPPGDARYAGPTDGGALQPFVPWYKGDVF